VRIAFIADKAPAPYRAGQLRQIAKLLREWAVEVTIAPAEAGVDALGPHDLHVVASERDAAFAVAGDLDARGAAVMNPYPSLAALRNPALLARRLTAANVPNALGGFPRDAAGVRLGAAGPELTLDGFGGQVFGVVRGGPGQRDQPFTIGPELYRVALRCARALELELFAIDLATFDGEPLVVGVRPFPALRGVPDAALRVADFVYAAAERAAEAPRAAVEATSKPELRLVEAAPAR
jgi:glutathione synthase/RimK-type ligase-like ATP-grasp enzyme